MNDTRRGGPDGMLLSSCFMGLGMHLSAWQARSGDASDYVNPDFYRGLAAKAESGKIHAIFLADTLTNAEEGTDRPALGALDPLVVLATCAGVTERIGLVGTSSTTFNDPYDLARRFATLDHLSNGRAAWNAVTTFVPAVAENFGGRPLPDRDERYDRADEFCEVVLKLWNSWQEGALVGDKDAGVFADPGAVGPIDHHGKHFEVRGPLTMPQSPQGRPAMFQAGSSGAGRDLAAKYGDVVFTAQNLVEEAVAFRRDILERAELLGRGGQVKVMPGLLAVLGATEAEARERKRVMDDAAGNGPELAKLARRIGIPVERLHLDRPIPVDELVPDEQFSGSVGFRNAAVNLAVKEGLTVRELLVRNGGGHLQVVGAPEQVADVIEEWWSAGAVDGFNLMIDMLPSGLDDAVDMLVPELQARGLFHQEYPFATLRENLGVAPVPVG